MKNTNPVKHWGSTYRADCNVDKIRNKSVRPSWSVNRVAYSSGRGYYETEFGDRFGENSFKLKEKDQEKEDLLNRRARELLNAKNNITDTYNVRIPGYAGHKPMSVINDRGNVRNTCLST